MRARPPSQGPESGRLSAFSHEADHGEGERYDENRTEKRTRHSDDFERVHLGGVRIAAWQLDRDVRGGQPFRERAAAVVQNM